MSIDDVLGRVAAFGCPLVEVTGGEPLLQPEAIPLMQALVDQGYTVLLETGGGVTIEHVPAGVRRIVDVKCPGSGESKRNLWSNLDHLRAGDELKFVIAGREDYCWAKEQIQARNLSGRWPLLFSCVHGGLDPAELARWVLGDRLRARIQLQLHKYLWPESVRGV